MSPPLVAERMGRLLAEEVERRGMTQAEFARRVGASAKHVNKVFNGSSTAYMATLDYWAFVLGCRWNVTLEPLEDES